MLLLPIFLGGLISFAKNVKSLLVLFVTCVNIYIYCNLYAYCTQTRRKRLHQYSAWEKFLSLACIFALNVLFDRHTVIFTASKPWTTLDPTGHENHSNFLSLCDFHLLNLGDNMFINLKLHEEERVFSTLPPGTTMSIFQTETPLETQYEFHYEITPPVINTDQVDTSDKEDCEVVDYFPHRTPRTNPRNKQLVDVIDGYLTPYMKQLSNAQEQPSLLAPTHIDDRFMSPDDSKSPNILSNNTPSQKYVSVGDSNALQSQTFSNVNMTCNIETGDVTCNNDMTEFNVTCSNIDNTDVENNVKCNNDAMKSDMTCSNIENTDVENNVNCINDAMKSDMTCNNEVDTTHMGSEK